VKPVELVIIGGSAGSLPVILTILSNLNPQLNFPIIIILHRKNTYDNTLTLLLSQKTTLPVKEVEDKDPLVPGTIYIAPADYHLLVEQDKTLSLDYSERINYSRPSIDATFETAALTYQDKLLAILLSGANADGTEGLKFVLDHEGTAIAQDPSTAEVPFMPTNAISKLPINYILSPIEICSAINELISKEKQ